MTNEDCFAYRNDHYCTVLTEVVCKSKQCKFYKTYNVDMTCRETELRDSLQNIGILIVPSMIYLDNRRTLQIQLNANDEVGEIVKTLINTERDTLGTVQRLCRSVYCLNAKHRAELLEMIENGEITTAAEGIEMAKRLREPMQMCR